MISFCWLQRRGLQQEECHTDPSRPGATRAVFPLAGRAPLAQARGRAPSIGKTLALQVTERRYEARAKPRRGAWHVQHVPHRAGQRARCSRFQAARHASRPAGSSSPRRTSALPGDGGCYGYGYGYGYGGCGYDR